VKLEAHEPCSIDNPTPVTVINKLAGARQQAAHGVAEHQARNRRKPEDLLNGVEACRGIERVPFTSASCIEFSPGTVGGYKPRDEIPIIF
jgi:hypothetical protein